jgi:hypothetical protein
MHVWALGRRSAKSTSAALIALWCCLLRPELLERLRPGERGYAVGVATNLRQARLLIRQALSIVERSPLLAELVESATEDEITFANGTGFAAFPCSSRGGRGWPVFAFELDEAGHLLRVVQVAGRIFSLDGRPRASSTAAPATATCTSSTTSPRRPPGGTPT